MKNKISYYNNSFEELISLNEASKITGLSSVHLRHLVSSGKIWGRKIGRNWVTSKPAINSYIKQKKRPGRPRKKSCYSRTTNSGNLLTFKGEMNIIMILAPAARFGWGRIM